MSIRAKYGLNVGQLSDVGDPRTPTKMGASGLEGGEAVMTGDSMPKGSQSNPYQGGEVEVSAAAPKTGFTGAVTNAGSGRAFPDAPSANAYSKGMASNKKVVTINQGNGSATGITPSVSERKSFKKGNIGQVQTDYGNGDVSTYANGQPNPAEVEADKRLSPADYAKKHNVKVTSSGGR